MIRRKLVLNREKLAELMKSKPITMKDLFFEFRFSPYQQRNFFNITPNTDTLMKIKAIFNVDPFELLIEDPIE